MSEYIKVILSLNLKCTSQGVPLPWTKPKFLLTSLGLNHALKESEGSVTTSKSQVSHMKSMAIHTSFKKCLILHAYFNFQVINSKQQLIISNIIYQSTFSIYIFFCVPYSIFHTHE